MPGTKGWGKDDDKEGQYTEGWGEIELFFILIVIMLCLYLCSGSGARHSK